MATSMINEEQFFRSGVKRLFTGQPWEIFNELFQNAQRSHAQHVWISFPNPRACVVQDDGHGLHEGLHSLRKLLVFSDSGFADPQVAVQQRPLGMGFYSLIANERVTSVTIESHAPPDGKILVFAIDTARWLDDGAYRESWQERVEWREPEGGEELGFRLTITGSEALMAEIRQCLLDTPTHRMQTRRYGIDGRWIRSEMSPACGYGDLLDVVVDGELLDTRLPPRITIRQPQIVDVYQGNPIRISLYEPPNEYHGGGCASLAINWYGQLILDDLSGYRGWHAYLHVRSGTPVTPKAPTRSGLVDDEALRSLYRWIEDRIFSWVCSQEQPPVQFVERLYAINRGRAEQECPFALIQRWKPLPADYVFTSYLQYDALYPGAGDEASSRDDEESDQLGPKQVARKSELGIFLLLDGRVICPLPASHPAQPWQRRLRFERGEARANDIIPASFEIGLTSLLSATRVEAYRAVVGVPAEHIHTLWWQPGEPVDAYYTTAGGKWGIQFFPMPETGLEACLDRIAWHPLPTGAQPVFVVDAPDSYSVANCCWIIALASIEALVPFLERCAYAAFEPDDDDEDESVESFEDSVKTLIRSYLPDAIARDLLLEDVPRAVQGFLPPGYDAREVSFKLAYNQRTGVLEGLHLSFSSPTGEEGTFREGYTKTLRFY